MHKKHIHIDAVIPWVDGNDKAWQIKINTYLNSKSGITKKKQSARFNSIGEIDICIKSIIKFAPFFKTIYLVTDNQTPDTFDDLSRLTLAAGIELKVIDHTIIFKDFENYLPCFNSRSIESVLFKIPNLSEHYVIFNDDTFIMRNAVVEDFFVDGLPVIRGKWLHFYENQTFKNSLIKTLESLGIKKTKQKIGNKKIMQNSAKLAGAKKYIRRYHTPIPIRKSTQLSFFENNNYLENNIKHRFRHESQFIISSLAEHLEFLNGSYVFDKNIKLTYFRTYKRFFVVKLKLALFQINRNKLFMTFQSLDLADKKTCDYILNWIDKKIQ